MKQKNKLMIAMLMIFVLASIANASAQVIIKTVDTTPAIIKPGEIADVHLVIWNTGNTRIDDINIKLDLTNLPLAPSESSTEKNIERLYSDDTESITFRILVLPTAESQVYKIPVQITENQTTKDSIISLDVQGKPELTAAIDENKAQVIGKTGDISIRLVNEGLGNIKFLNVKLMPSDTLDIISSDSSYVGDLKAGETDTATFKIQPKAGDVTLKLSFDYKDQNNKDYTITKNLEMKVYTEQEAVQLGIIQKNNSMIYLGIILVVILYFIIRNILKKRRKK